MYLALFIAGLGYVLAFFYPQGLWGAHALLFGILVLVLADAMLLFLGRDALVKAERLLPEKLSNGDANTVKIDLMSRYPFAVKVRGIDELPFQFQKRDFFMEMTLKARSGGTFQYELYPKSRGVYEFGGLNVFVSSPLGLLARRFVFGRSEALPCYPSFVHLRKYELMALQNEFLLGGIKKIRRLGHTLEFEQIKEYVQGDDIRTINWKATSKQNRLMVNQYQDEKSQRIYLLVDKGRTMQMPFEGLSLLDYSINAVMALSHIVLRKGDRAGVMTFARKAENKVAADHKPDQLRKISETLYKVQTNFEESDFGRLYQDVRMSVGQRSLMLLFTNFETLDGLRRQMNYLRGIAKNHLLVVVFFKNTELQGLLDSHPKTEQAIYDKIIAEKFEYEKKLIIQELRKYGISAVYTKPENLNIEVINKYLEIKSRGML